MDMFLVVLSCVTLCKYMVSPSKTDPVLSVLVSFFRSDFLLHSCCGDRLDQRLVERLVRLYLYTQKLEL